MRLNWQIVARVTGILLAATVGISLGVLLAAGSFYLENGSLASPKVTSKPRTPIVRPHTPTPAGSLPETEVAAAATAEAATAEPQAVKSQRVTVMVVGMDSRPGEAAGRTDSIMVLTIDPQAGTAGMLSMARDLLVPIPGLAQSAKINTAYGYGQAQKVANGGPKLLEKTITNLIGYPIDYYVRINFDGFRQIIDQIGGIDVDVAKTIDDPTYPDDNYGYDPLYIPAGRAHMDGELALKYARTRHVDSDYGRARRQQQVVLAVKEKLLQPGHLAALLPRLPGLAVALAKTVQTDMPMDKAVELASLMTRLDTKTITSAVIDDAMGKDANDPTWGFVLIPDMAKVKVAADTVFGKQTQTLAQAKPTAQPTVKTEAARVAVLNGTHGQGLASRMAAGLLADGYNVVGVGDADSTNYAESWLICYGNPAPATKDALVAKFSIQPDHIRSETSVSGVDLMVILGADLPQASNSLATQ